MPAASLSAQQIRVANANKWFSGHRFPESKVINALRLHQRTDFRVKLRDTAAPQPQEKTTGIYPATDSIGAIERNPIGRGQIAIAEDFKDVSQDPKSLFSSLIEQGLFDAEGLVPDTIYAPEVLDGLGSGVAGVMKLIKGNAYFLNYDIVMGKSNADNPITFFESIDRLVAKHFAHGDPDSASSMWSGRLRYGLLSAILAGEHARMDAAPLISAMNGWFSAEENWLYTDTPDSPRTYHAFMLGASNELAKPSILPVTESKISEHAVRHFHRIAVPAAYLSDPVRFLDWSGKLIASRHKPCVQTGIAGKFWSNSVQVALFLAVLKGADFSAAPKQTGQ